MSKDSSNPENITAVTHPLVIRAQNLLAHAWMVRTFIKHAPETEDFPELMGIVRSVFDTSRALETRINAPAPYFKMLGKKLGKLKAATEQFAQDAPIASTHTNFAQAVISMQTVVQDLLRLQDEYLTSISSSNMLVTQNETELDDDQNDLAETNL